MSTADQIRVGLRSLRADAKMWQEQMAETANRAHSEAQGLTLGTSQMSWAGEASGLVATYEAVHQKALRLTSGAEQNFLAVADALRTAADGYESSDEATGAGLAKTTR